MMRRKFLLLLVFVVGLLSIPLATPQSANADNCPLQLDKSEVDTEYKDKITITGDCFVQDKEYSVLWLKEGRTKWQGSSTGEGVDHDVKANSTNSLTFTLNVLAGDIGSKDPGNWTILVCIFNKSMSSCNDDSNIVGRATIKVGGDALPDSYDLPTIKREDQAQCIFQTESNVTLKVTNLSSDLEYYWWMVEDDDHNGDIPVESGQTEATFVVPGGAFKDVEEKTICVDKKGEDTKTDSNCIKLDFKASPPEGDTSCHEFQEPVNIPLDPPCKVDIGPDGCTSVNTSLGEMFTSPDSFLTRIFSVLLSLSGGIALLLIIRSGYQMMTSQGNPEKVKEAQDRITSAVVGLLFIIFSIVILEVIGVDLLNLPGLGR